VSNWEIKFRSFVQHHHNAIAAKAIACFQEYERGVVVIRVRHLEGEEEFRLEQESLPLEYKTLDDYMEEGGKSGKFDTEMLNILRRYDPEAQAVVVAQHMDGETDFAVIKAGKAMAAEAVQTLEDDDYDDDDSALLGAAMGGGAASFIDDVENILDVDEIEEEVEQTKKKKKDKKGKKKKKDDVPVGEAVDEIPRGKKVAKPKDKKKKKKEKAANDDSGLVPSLLETDSSRSAIRPSLGDSSRQSPVRKRMPNPGQSAIHASLGEARSGRSAIRAALQPQGDIVRDRVLMVQLSKDEQRALDAIADAMDQPDTSTWARRALLDSARKWGKELKKKS
jgi:hypothetical protein